MRTQIWNLILVCLVGDFLIYIMVSFNSAIVNHHMGNIFSNHRFQANLRDGNGWGVSGGSTPPTRENSGK